MRESILIGRNQFIPLRHTMLAKIIRVRRIEQSPSARLAFMHNGVVPFSSFQYNVMSVLNEYIVAHSVF